MKKLPIDFWIVLAIYSACCLFDFDYHGFPCQVCLVVGVMIGVVTELRSGLNHCLMRRLYHSPMYVIILIGVCLILRTCMDGMVFKLSLMPFSGCTKAKCLTILLLLDALNLCLCNKQRYQNDWQLLHFAVSHSSISRWSDTLMLIANVFRASVTLAQFWLRINVVCDDLMIRIIQAVWKLVWKIMENMWIQTGCCT